jgi:hypothetical protein
LADSPAHTWYVSFEVEPRTGVRIGRTTVTFPSESEAKAFALSKLDEARNISAGTINPHWPKQTIGSGRLNEWLSDVLETER